MYLKRGVDATMHIWRRNLLVGAAMLRVRDIAERLQSMVTYQSRKRRWADATQSAS